MPSEPQVKPEGEDRETLSETAPWKPFIEVTVIVEEPEDPARIAPGLTVPAEMEKSGADATWKVMLAVM